MQYWVYFKAGAGGDGLCNLLEHCCEVTPLDTQYYDLPMGWRLHRIIDNEYVKFHFPYIDSNDQIRRGIPFNAQTNQLSNAYLDAVHSGANIMVPSHDTYGEFENQSDVHAQHIWKKNRFTIGLYSKNQRQRVKNYYMKSLIPHPDNVNECWKWECEKYPPLLPEHTRSADYDLYVCLEEITATYNEFKYFAKELGLTCTEQVFEQYRIITDFSDIDFVEKNVPTESYTTVVKDGWVQFDLIYDRRLQAMAVNHV